MSNLDQRISEDLAFMLKNYAIIFYEQLAGEEPFIIEDVTPDEVRRCRFCAKGEPDVSFRNKAHAIPELLGNKRVILRNECDTCNAFFASTIEDHLGRAILPMRTMSQVTGKRGVPTHKSKDGKARIDMGDAGLEIKLEEGHSLLKINEQGSIGLALETQQFVPLAAAKCFSKIACSIMPQCELQFFDQTIKWLMTPDHAAFQRQFESVPIQVSFLPGPKPYKAGQIFLLQRRNKEANVPYMIVVVACGNYILQTFVPFCRKDKHLSEMILRHFPLPCGADWQYGPPVHYHWDWSGAKPTTHPLTMGLHCDKMVPMDPSPSTED